MDGIGDVYNYIREGGDWDTVEDNMRVLNTIDGIDIAAGITVQAHNVFQMPEFYDFWKETDINPNFITANMVQTPKYLGPIVWHSRYHDAIVEKLRAAESRHPEMDRFYMYMENNEKNYSNYIKFRKYTRDIEKRYQPQTNLKKMVKDYLNMELEDMHQVFVQQEQFGVKPS